MSASISPDGLYRYWLARRWSIGERLVVFIGLNPSTADHRVDDPTIRRCVGFAKSWGYDWLLMGNLYAYRSTDPKPLKELVTCPIGDKNEDELRWMLQRANLVVAAWGGEPLNEDAKEFARHICSRHAVKCLGRNKDGSPKHPLYLSAATKLVPFW